ACGLALRVPGVAGSVMWVCGCPGAADTATRDRGLAWRVLDRLVDGVDQQPSVVRHDCQLGALERGSAFVFDDDADADRVAVDLRGLDDGHGVDGVPVRVELRPPGGPR